MDSGYRWCATAKESLCPLNRVLKYNASLQQSWSFDFAELEHLGIAPEAVLDFSVNGNPYGPSPRVREAIAHVPLDRYPDREALALRRVLAAQLHVPLEQLLVGNGSSELLWLLALAFLRPEDRVVLVGPTFGAYARAVAVMGAHLEQYTAMPEAGFRVDPAAVARALRHLQPRLAFICNPNNPTGTLLHPRPSSPGRGMSTDPGGDG